MAASFKKNHLETLVGSNISYTNGNTDRADLKRCNFTFSERKEFEEFHKKGETPDIPSYFKNTKISWLEKIPRKF